MVVAKKTPNDLIQIIAIICWDGIKQEMATYSYHQLAPILGPHGIHASRKCEYNAEVNCLCQGIEKQGASISFGCSFQSHLFSCKWRKSKDPDKFKLEGADDFDSKAVSETLNNLANFMSKILEKAAPDAFSNMVKNSVLASDCRIGSGDFSKRPFSGVTAVTDFCAHRHQGKITFKVKI